MIPRYLLPVCIIFWAASNAGCGCGERNIEGDTGLDGDAVVSFDPPIENIGEPGWRDSSEPWCVGGALERSGFDIWSDSRGVFVLLEVYSRESPHEREHTVYFNEGTGWGPYISGLGDGYETCVASITGIPGGALLGWDSHSTMCQLSTFDDGTVRAEGFSVHYVFGVSEDLAYAIPVGDPRIVKFEGGSWGPLPGDPIPFQIYRLWANEEVIFGCGPSGVMLSTVGGEWTVHDTRTMNDFGAIWGFSAEDVWASTIWPPALLHYDGETWEQIEWPDMSDPDNLCDSSEISGMWGKDGTLFFHTWHQFVQWDGSDFTVLGHWPSHFVGDDSGGNCIGGMLITAIWGNEVDEVFLAIKNSGLYDADCGEEYLLWWDGSEFHWF